MVIDSTQIRCFLMVAELLSFTKAADELYLSQSALSRKIAAMEKELGVILFDRTNHTVALTSEGEELRDYFSNFSTGLTALLGEIDAKQQRNSGVINLGIFEGWDLSDVIRATASDFNQQHKNICFTYGGGNISELRKGFQSKRYNALLLLKTSAKRMLAHNSLQDVEIDELFLAQKCIVYAACNPVAKLAHPTLSDFKGQTLHELKSELLPASLSVNQPVLLEAGLEPQTVSFPTLDALSMSLLTGEGFAILDTSMRITHHKDICCLLLDEFVSVCLVTPKNPPPAVAAFRQYCLSQMGRYEEE